MKIRKHKGSSGRFGFIIHTMLIHRPQEDEKCYKVKVIQHPEEVRRQAGYGTDFSKNLSKPWG